MTDITIPPEALEAFLREVETHEENISEAAARAACLAMLRGWPGMWHYRGGWEPVVHNKRKPHVILPLPKENTNDN